MNKIYKLIIPIVLLTFNLTSCDVKDEGDLMSTNSKYTASVVTSNVVMNEGENAVIEINVDKPSKVPLIFKLRQIDGDAVMGTDFEFAENSEADFGEIGGKIVIPAYETTGTLVVSSLSDYFSSANKSASFVLESMESMNGLASGKVNLTIDNAGPSEIISKLTWDTNECGDVDFYIINPAFDSIIAIGDSTDMPEITSGIAASDPDGVYTVWMHAWDVADGVDNFDLNWGFSKPDGMIDYLDMNYDYANQNATYSYINIGILVYNVVNIEKTGSNFNITLAN